MTCSTKLNVKTYAALAGDVYNDSGAPEGWKRLEMPAGLTANSDNGFYAAAYQNNETGEIVVAYRGSQEGVDWVSNVQIGVGLEPDQYNNAEAFYKAVKEQNGDASISLTGHSLGGGLAQLVAASTHNDDRVSATAFNAPGVSGSLDNIAGAPADGDYSYVENYNAQFDPVSNLTDLWLDQLGNQHTVYAATDMPDWMSALAPNPAAYAAIAMAHFLVDQHLIDAMIAASADMKWIAPQDCPEEPIEKIKEKFAAAETIRSPLVLDLNGDGITTTGVTDGAHFDHDANGFAEATGWANGEDGLLVRDLDGNGTIDTGRELFGSETLLANGQKAANGYEALKELDTNQDGLITQNEAELAGLKIWKDANSDGFSTADELFTLADAGVHNIATGYTEIPHIVQQSGSYTKTDGSTGDVADLLIDSGRAAGTDDTLMLETNEAGRGLLLSNGQMADNAYQVLADLDNNFDGLINGQDAAYTDLKIWRNSNNNGYIDAGELLSLADAGILSITTSILTDPSGNSVNQTSTFTKTDGSTGTSADIWFQTNTTNTIATDWLPETATIAALPDLQGSGNVYDLHQAMLRDGGGHLQDMVQQFISETDIAARHNLTTQLIYAWAGVENIDPASRSARLIYGNAIGDARKLASLEALLGEDYLGTWCWDERDPNPHGPAAKMLLQAFDELAGNFYSQLMAQTHFRPLLDSIAITWNAATDQFGWDISNTVVLLQNLYTADPINSALTLSEFANVLKQSGDNGLQVLEALRVQGDLGGDEFSVLLGRIGLDNSTVGIDNILVGSNNDDVMYGMDGQDNLHGLAGNDYLDGGSGHDYLEGGAGNDVYIFNRGDGHDDIFDWDVTANNTDTLRFGAGIAVGDITFARNGYDLVLGISGSADQITVWNYGAGAANRIERVEFTPPTGQAGTTLETRNVRWELVEGTEGNDALFVWADENNVTVRGMGGDDLLVGFDNIDTLDGGMGTDTLRGFAGDDVYLFNPGDGQDTIDDHDTTPGNLDTIRFGAGINPADITFARSGYDLVLGINGTTDQITIRNWGKGDDYRIERIEFADSPAWDANYIQVRAATIPIIGTDGDDTLHGETGDNYFDGGLGNDALSGGAGNDLYLFNPGDGQDTIEDHEATPGNLNAIRFGAGINPAGITFTRSGLDLVLGINGTTDQITIQNWGADSASRMEAEFADDATVWDPAYMQAQISDEITGTAGNDIQAAWFDQNTVMRGLAGADTLIGNDGADILEGGSGDDILRGGAGGDYLDGGVGNDTLDSGAGADTFVLELGAGQDQIVASDYLDTLVFGAGIAQASVTVSRTDAGMLLRYGDAGDSVLISSDSLPDALQFADGATLSLGDFIPDQGGYAVEGSAAGESLVDLHYWARSFDAGAGDDTLMAGSGNTTYRFNLGDGQDNLIDLGGLDTIAFGAGISAGDITFVYEDRGDYAPMFRVYYGSGDVISILNGERGAIEQFSFADGTRYSFAQMAVLQGFTPPTEVLAPGGLWIPSWDIGNKQLIVGTTGNDIIEAYNDATPIAIYAAGKGDDRIQINENDGTGVASLLFNLGDGHDTINVVKNSAFNSLDHNTSLIFGSGITPDSLTFSQSGADQIITYGTRGDSILVEGGLDDSAGFEFAAGYSYSYFEMLLGGSIGGGVISGGLQSGTTTYQFNLGGGSQVIDAASATAETVSFGPGITPDLLGLGLGSLLIRVGDDGDELHLTGFNPDDVYAPSPIQNFNFADGATLTYNQLIDLGFDLKGGAQDDVITGTNTTDRIDGYEGDDTLSGGAGSDVVNGGAGNDTYLFGYGDGVDRIYDYDTNANLDTVLFAASVNPEDVAVVRNGEDLELRLFDLVGGANSSDRLILSNWYMGTAYQIEQVQFADGTVWDTDYLQNRAPLLPVMGTDGDDTLYSLGGVDNHLQGLGGDDLLVGSNVGDTLDGGAGRDTLAGSIGLDTYLFNSGDGQDTIIDSPDTAGNTIRFGAGITAADVRFFQQGVDLHITYGIQGDSVLIKDFAPYGLTGEQVITQLVFADGSHGAYTFDDWGNVSMNTYDVNGNLLSESWQDSSGNFESYIYDANGNLLSETWQNNNGYGSDTYNADGSSSGTGYNPDGSYYTYTDDGLGAYNELDYGADGSLTGSYTGTSDGLGNSTGTTYDANGARLSDWWNHADGSYGSDTYNADGSSLGDMHNPDGTYSDYADDGLGNVHTSIYDAGGNLLSDSWTHANSAPLAGIFGDQAATQGAAFNYLLPAGSFSDPDANDTLTYTATLANGDPLPGWLSFDAATQTFSGTPGNADAGNLNLVVTATDTGGLSDAGAFNLSVANVNDAPVMTMQVADQLIAQGTPWNLPLPAGAFTDQDFIHGDSLTYSATLADGTALPAWLTCDAASGKLSGTAGIGDTGVLPVRIVATDTAGLSATANFNLTVANMITGTIYNDTINGTADLDYIQALAGNDLVNAGDGNDTIIGGAGSDVLAGGAGDDTFQINGTDTSYDRFQGDTGYDVIRGGDGDDVIRAKYFTGASTVEKIDGGLGVNVIAGTQYNDTIDLSNTELVNIASIDGGVGNDVITGSAGNDIIIGGAGSDVLAGGLGEDTFQINGTDTSYDRFQGDDGYDVILGSDGDDTVRVNYFTGASTVEKIDGGLGINVIAGTQYNDTIDLSNTELVNIANIDGGAGNDVITGSAGSDTIIGGAGSDVLAGGAGDDTFQISGTDTSYDRFQGDAGYDVIQGGDGDDTIRVNYFTGAYTVEKIDGGLGLNVIAGTQYNDTIDLSNTELANIANIDGGVGNDVITGSAGNDLIIGGAGSDVLAGGAGDDTFLISGTDTAYDRFQGDAGYDIIRGGDSDDTLRVNYFTGAPTVEKIDGGLGVNVIAGTQYNDTIDLSGTELANIANIDGGIGNDVITGSAGSDLIIGGAGSDVLAGGAGDDTFQISGTDTSYDRFQGDAGYDVIQGGDGDDTIRVNYFTGASTVEKIDGGLGINTVAGTQYNDTIDLSNTELVNIASIDGGAGNDVITGSAGNDLLFGGDGSDNLNGSAGNDMLQGGLGNDKLTGTSGNNLFDGGAGTDTLTGNSGNELFIGGAGNDTITTGTGADIIAFNRGDGQDAVNASAGADNTISLGGGIDYQSLSMSKSGSNLILSTGNGDQVTLRNWYSNTANHSVANLQLVLDASAYNASSTDPLLNRQVQDFDFALLAQNFDQALAANPTLTSWNLTDSLLSAHLAGSDTAALGGDLAYQYNLNGTLAGIGLASAQTVMNDVGFGVSAQQLHPLAELQTGTARLG